MEKGVYYEVYHAGNTLYISTDHSFIVKTRGAKGVVNHSLMISDKNHLGNETGIKKQIFR